MSMAAMALYRCRIIKCIRALVEELKDLVIMMPLPAELSLLNTREALLTQLRHMCAGCAHLQAL